MPTTRTRQVAARTPSKRTPVATTTFRDQMHRLPRWCRPWMWGIVHGILLCNHTVTITALTTITHTIGL